MCIKITPRGKEREQRELSSRMPDPLHPAAWSRERALQAVTQTPSPTILLTSEVCLISPNLDFLMCKMEMIKYLPRGAVLRIQQDGKSKFLEPWPEYRECSNGIWTLTVNPYHSFLKRVSFILLFRESVGDLAQGETKSEPGCNCVCVQSPFT